MRSRDKRGYPEMLESQQLRDRTLGFVMSATTVLTIALQLTEVTSAASRERTRKVKQV